MGMHGGPHEGGPASYPVGDAESGFTSVSSTMTVPEMPAKLDGICYYIWTDIFFGDMSNGRMNQFVPQLILGNALDGSSGPPLYKPHFGEHRSYQFGAHYFFEVVNGPDPKPCLPLADCSRSYVLLLSDSTMPRASETSGKLESHAAYGDMFPAKAGEVLETSFVATPGKAGAGPVWTLTMRALGVTLSSQFTSSSASLGCPGYGCGWRSWNRKNAGT